MELSKRLQAVAGLVTAGYEMADIGTDHAYIPIYLIENGMVPSAVAMDINEGPLERAKEHVTECGLSGRIELRLSDGLAGLAPGEAKTAVIAGMGGGLVMKILKAYPDITGSLKECILQPQSEIAKVRAFLLEEGFLFIKEDMVFEDGKYYPMMKVQPSAGSTLRQKRETPPVWTETEIRYGKLLLQNRHPVLKQFLEREITLKSRIIRDLENLDSPHSKERRRELEKDLEYARKGMEFYAM